MRTRPLRLQKGDTIGIIAPSSPPNIENLNRSLAFLEQLGLNVKMGKHVEKINGYLAGTDDERLEDLHDMLSDPNVKGIICAGGGFGAADLINIKLMKAGGIYQALKINALAESYGVECMTGSMIETKLGISAAAHFAASQPNVTRFDFDAPLMLAEDIVEGGITYEGRHIRFSKLPGLGLHSELMNKRFFRKG